MDLGFDVREKAWVKWILTPERISKISDPSDFIDKESEAQRSELICSNDTTACLVVELRCDYSDYCFSNIDFHTDHLGLLKIEIVSQ